MEQEKFDVEISGVTKRFAQHAVLRNVSIRIPSGKIVGLLGPNGSGKTTLLKIVAGLLLPNEGTVSVFGQNPTAAALRQHIGWMPAEERSGFYGRLTGRQNLEFFASLYNLPKKEIDRVIGNLAFLLDVDEELEKQALQSSTGARQKVALCRTLLHNPSLLILDEPLRNLDPHALKRFRRLLRDHLTRREKKTVLLSSHQLDEVRRLVDYVVVLRKGEVLFSADIDVFEKKLDGQTWEDFYLDLIDSAEEPL